MVQRYKFESKSQRQPHSSADIPCCFQWFKGTNLKANHNMSGQNAGSVQAVSNGSKVQIWKQITTKDMKSFDWEVLFPMVQRYKFESKSQQWSSLYRCNRCCFQWFKGTNLKANHNVLMFILKIWKLFPMVQRYKFESKSQPILSLSLSKSCCFQWFKGTNLKANHNCCGCYWNVESAVSNGSKVQIWKQITTWRYKSSSCVSCFQWFKGTNLKANHNNAAAWSMANIAVSNGSKVQIWKQITTSLLIV